MQKRWEQQTLRVFPSRKVPSLVYLGFRVTKLWISRAQREPVRKMESLFTSACSERTRGGWLHTEIELDQM